MNDNNYRYIALQWSPDAQKGARRFYSIMALVSLVTLLLCIVVVNVSVPPETQRVVTLPDRVAQYLSEKPKPSPPPAVTPPAPPPPLPLVHQAKPTVIRKLERQDELPLTQEEKSARDVAAKSGLVALNSELSDLLDSSAADVNVRAGLHQADTSQVASVSTDALLTSDSSKTEKIDNKKYLAQINASQLESREKIDVKQTLFKENEKGEVVAATNSGKTSAGTSNKRSEEAISMVFDQNKSSLFSIYNRERRNTPGLKGKLVLELNIAPDGSVISVKILHSELNNSTLEQRIVARVKQFNFGAGNLEPVKVTFPIEFLPSAG